MNTDKVITDKIRHEWVCAVLENRMATADYLAADLPALADDLIRPPNDVKDLEYWAVAGEICE